MLNGKQTRTRLSDRVLRYDGRTLPNLDGMRAVAILLVLLFHGLYNSDTAAWPRLHSVAEIAGKVGAMGVLIFFSLSGFLITLRLIWEEQQTGDFSVRAFYVKRIFRILPPVFVYLSVLVLLGITGVIQLQSGDQWAPVFLTNYRAGSWYTSHFWSLAVEEHFYLLWPACVLLFGWRRALWVGVAIVACVAVWRPWVLHHTTTPARALQHTDLRLDYIMMGCIVAIAACSYGRAADLLRLAGSTAGSMLLVAALAFSIVPLGVDTRSVQAVLLALLVCGAGVGTSRLLAAVLGNPPMLFLGRISFSVYIWQQLFLGVASFGPLRSPLALLLKYPLILLISCGSYYLLERPAIAFGRRFLKHSRPEVLLTSTPQQDKSSSIRVA